MHHAPARTTLSLALLAALLAGAVVVRLHIGGDGPTPEATAQIVALRWTSVWTGITVGAALAVCGVVLQSLLRNPLASPDLLGLASGAGFGVMLVVYAGFLAGLGIASAESGGGNGGLWTTTTAAIAGALGALALVYALSQRRGLLDPVTLVLVGVVISILCGAGVTLLKSLMPDQGLAASRLLMGRIDPGTTPQRLWPIAALTAAGTLAALAHGRAMDAAALGDDEAVSVGVRLPALRLTLFATAGVLAAGSVVLAGPIGFVGLICPHAVRLLAGPSHRVLIAGSALAGAALVVAADAATRAIDLGSGKLPIGVLTSLIGGPVLLAMLRRTRAAA